MKGAQHLAHTTVYLRCVFYEKHGLNDTKPGRHFSLKFPFSGNEKEGSYQSMGNHD